MAFACVAPIPGCGSGKGALEEKIHSLEKEISQMRSEKVNLEARAGALDDRVVLLDKKLKRCGVEKSPLLEVVRLRPSEEEIAPGFEKENLETVETDGKQKRPVLVLRGMPMGRSAYPVRSLPIGPGEFASYGPENLGVLNSKTRSEGDEGLSGGSGEMDEFNEAYRAYSNKMYEQALKGFSRFVEKNPEHPYADNALFWRGECFLAIGKFFQGIGEFERLHRRYPKSDSAASGLYRIGFSYDQLRDRAKALEYYFQVVDKYPNTDAARRASRRVSALESLDGRSGRGVVPTTAER